MNENRLKGLAGLCVRAGQAVFGEDSCTRTVRSGQCGILLIDGNASDGTKKRYQSICRTAGIPCTEMPADWIETATGKTGMAMGVKRGPFSDQITECL